MGPSGCGRADLRPAGPGRSSCEPVESARVRNCRQRTRQPPSVAGRVASYPSRGELEHRHGSARTISRCSEAAPSPLPPGEKLSLTRRDMPLWVRAQQRFPPAVRKTRCSDAISRCPRPPGHLTGADLGGFSRLAGIAGGRAAIPARDGNVCGFAPISRSDHRNCREIAPRHRVPNHERALPAAVDHIDPESLEQGEPPVSRHGLPPFPHARGNAHDLRSVQKGINSNSADAAPGGLWVWSAS